MLRLVMLACGLCLVLGSGAAALYGAFGPAGAAPAAAGALAIAEGDPGRGGLAAAVPGLAARGLAFAGGLLGRGGADGDAPPEGDPALETLPVSADAAAPNRLAPIGEPVPVHAGLPSASAGTGAEVKINRGLD